MGCVWVCVCVCGCVCEGGRGEGGREKGSVLIPSTLPPLQSLATSQPQPWWSSQLCAWCTRKMPSRKGMSHNRYSEITSHNISLVLFQLHPFLPISSLSTYLLLISIHSPPPHNSHTHTHTHTLTHTHTHTRAHTHTHTHTVAT